MPGSDLKFSWTLTEVDVSQSVKIIETCNNKFELVSPHRIFLLPIINIYIRNICVCCI